MKYLTIIVSLLLATSGLARFGDCDLNEYRYLNIELVPDNPDLTRNRIMEYAKTHQLPAFVMQAPYGNVPVILVNKQTLLHWSPLFHQTFGIAESLHPKNEANHGHARLPGKVEGDVQTILMDLFSPPNAGANAMHGTGYRWKSIQEYFAKRKPGSTQFIDLAYAASAKELEQFYLVHAAKRAALFRIVYKFEGDPYNEWNRQQRRMLFEEEGREHCNNSRLGGCGASHSHQMRARIAELGIVNLNNLYVYSETQRFLDMAKRQLLEADWKNPDSMNPNMFDRKEYFELMGKHLPNHLNHDQKVDLLTYIVSTNIVEEAITLQYRKGIVESRTEQYENSNLSAIMIYDEYAGTPEGFFTGQARFQGAPSGRGFGSPFATMPLFDNPTSIDWSRWAP